LAEHIAAASIGATAKAKRTSICRLCGSFITLYGLRLGLADVKRCDVNAVFEVPPVMFLDHLNTGAVVLCHLINIGPFKQTQADRRKI
jgi:hypothetical protein